MRTLLYNVAMPLNQFVRTWTIENDVAECLVLLARGSSHFPTLNEVQWPSLSLESQYLPKESWHSRTIKVNFHFQQDTGQTFQIRDRPGSFGTVGTYNIIGHYTCVIWVLNSEGSIFCSSENCPFSSIINFAFGSTTSGLWLNMHFNLHNGNKEIVSCFNTSWWLDTTTFCNIK